MKTNKLILILMLLIVLILHSQTIFFVTESGDGNMDGSSWVNALPGDSLQAALNNSNEGDEVWVAKGIYKPNSWPAGGSEDREKHFGLHRYNRLYGGFSGTETSLSQRHILENETILSGDIGIEGDNSDNCYHVIKNGMFDQYTVDDIIDGFTISDGNADGGSDLTAGGILNKQSAPIIRFCTFRQNHAKLGGAVANWDNDQTPLTIENCLFYDNYAEKGGAIYSAGVSTVITNCTIVNNTVTASAEMGGAAIYMDRSDYPGSYLGINEITNNIIWGNTKSQIYFYSWVSYVKIYFNAIGGYIAKDENYIGNIDLSPNNEGDYNSPYFTDPDNNDWTLQSLSPCIDSGIFWNALDADINFDPRPQGFCYDMGIYEYESIQPYADFPSVSTLPAENIFAANATLKGNITSAGETQLIAKGIKYSLSSGFDPEEEGTLIRLMEPSDVGEFELIVTNLKPDSTYYFRAYCASMIGCAYGSEELSFTTPDSLLVIPDANGIVYVKENGTGNGSSWANALSGYDLQDGINTEGVKEVWIAKGIYKPHSRLVDVDYGRDNCFILNNSLYGGFNGTETSIDQRNIKENETILSGDIGIEGDNSDNCYCVAEPRNDNNIIDGFTITDGYADGSSMCRGAGILTFQIGMIIKNCTFKNNYASYWGGAIANLLNESSPIIIKNCLFYGNSSAKGGAIYSSGASNIITNCTIVNNTADEGSGIYLDTPDNYMPGSLIGKNEVTNNIIWGNKGSEQVFRNWSASYVKLYFNAVEGGFDGFNNYVLSSNNEGEIYSPFFIDPLNNDWTLQSSSPCIDSGVFWNALETDIILAPRPQGVCYDMGAYEFESSQPNASLPIISTLPAENISATYATLKGYISDDGGTQLIGKGVKYSNTSGFNPETEGTLVRLLELLNEGEFELFITNLSPDTTYYYRAYCESMLGCAYGSEELSFSTTDSIIINPDANGIVYVKEDGTGDGSSWANALNGIELQNGIDNIKTKEVWVAKGKYKPMNWPGRYAKQESDEKYNGTTEREKHFSLRNEKKLFGGFLGTETSIVQRNIRTNETILTGDIGVKEYTADNCYHVIYHFWELDSTAVLDGFTVQDGYADGSIRDDSYFGGGIMSRYTSLSIRDCVFKNNYAISGGAMYYGFESSTTRPLIINTIIKQNTSEFGGGGICNFGAYPTLKNCLIIKNTAFGNGGGIHHIAEYSQSMTSDTLKIYNCTITDNIAQRGSGIHIKSDCMTGNNREIMKNSVIWGDSLSFTFEYEYLYGPIQTVSHCAITGGYYGEGNIDLSPNNSGDPNSPYFSDPENNNWMIQEYSPLRDAGIWTAVVPLYDLVGFARDALPDIGCYEWDPTGIEDNEPALALTTKLYQNYPNPFNPVTNIKFDLNKTGKVELSIYNIAGQLVRKLVDKEMSAGYHSVRFEADDLNSGMYFYMLKTNDKKLTRKMIMVK